MPAPPSHVVLTGLPGSGKTTVGRLLAIRLDRPFFDIDQEIERLIGKGIPQIFHDDGEPGFRAAEAAASLALAEQATPSVIAAGGGWATNMPAVAHLRPFSRIIYLRVSPAEAIRRMGARVSTRPLLATGDPVVALAALEETRRPVYERVADWTVDTERLVGDTLIEYIVEHLVEQVSTLPTDFSKDA